MKAVFTLTLWLGVSLAVQAYDPLKDKDKIDYTPPAEEWREAVVDIPSAFDPNDLQCFTLKGRNERFDYAIERKSLHTADDWVTRFIVVIRSQSGAINSSYEGLQCGHRRYKVYAYGSGEGMTPTPDPEWQPIPKGASDYRAILYEDLICNMQTGQPNPPEAVFQAMRDDRKVDASYIGRGQ